MVEVADDGVTRLDVTGIESWLSWTARAAAGLSTALGEGPEGASTVVGKDGRLAGGRRLGLRHDAALYRGGELTSEIGRLVRQLRQTASRVVDDHASIDASGADALDRAQD
ncbi:MAG: hypothetical protein ACRDT6_01260 [Micromonosporaceae bacterium]